MDLIYKVHENSRFGRSFEIRNDGWKFIEFWFEWVADLDEWRLRDVDLQLDQIGDNAKLQSIALYYVLHAKSLQNMTYDDVWRELGEMGLP